MKERFVSGIKKIAVMLIASAMVLGLIPVGLITLRSTTDNTGGEFLRLYPVLETFVSAKRGEIDKTGPELDADTLPAGRYHDSYIRFDLRDFLETDIDDITNAKLRITPISTEGNADLPINLSIMENNNWTADMDYNSKPSDTHDIRVADIDINSSMCGEVPVEVDLTEYIKKYITDKREFISLCLDGLDTGTAVFAGTSYEDKAFRPCLKITTGDATDPDFSDLKKSNLESVSVADNEETHLKFNLNPYNIQGAMYSIALSLNSAVPPETSDISVYCSDILAYHSDAAALEDMQNIDITDTVNDLYARGTTSLDLRVTGVQADAGKLNIQVSDNPNVTAVTEGLIYALEQNSSPSEITGRLSESYTTESGTQADFNWSAVYADTGEDASDILNSDGSVNQPHWFDDSRKIIATASVTSGEYNRTREFSLNIQPQALPDYTGNEFTYCVNFGSSKNEDMQKVEYIGTETHSDWISGKIFSYRTLTPGDILAFNIKSNTEAQNYLTLKLTAGNTKNSSLVIENLQNRQAAPIIIEPNNKLSEEGFVYFTYPLPSDYPTDKGYTAFRLTCTGETATETPEESTAADEPEATTASTAETVAEPIVPTWNIYGAYITQTPYFDPLEFSEQGEALVEKTSLENTSFYDLLKKLYRSVIPHKEIEPSEEMTADDTAVTPQTWLESEDSTLAFTDGENSVAIVLPTEGGLAEIHRSTIYYDSYSEVAPESYNDGRLTAVNYGLYRIFINNSNRRPSPVPWEEQGLSGIYRDLVSDEYYAFLGDGMAADDSVLPEGAALHDGKSAELEPGRTMILSFLAEPLYFPDWRVSEINGKSISQTKITKETAIDEITIKNVGTATETAKELQVICGVYERGMVINMEQKPVTVISGHTEYRIQLDNIMVKPGQTVKVFIEQSNQPPKAMTAKLELS